MHLLLINPWIYDFAAYDMWAKPLGLLYLASMLRRAGAGVSYIDCIDRYHWSLRDNQAKDKAYGCGKYPAVEIPKPEPLKFIPRRYKRYGISIEAFLEDLHSVDEPDTILITSRMTYWYPAVKETIRLCRNVFKNTPVLLGGTYPTLMPRHAERVTGADYVIPGEGEARILDFLAEKTGMKVDVHSVSLHDLDTLPRPAFDLYPDLHYGVVQTSRGCPYHCRYCASSIVNPSFRHRSTENVVDEILWLEHDRGVKDFAFYDDALLEEPENHFIPIMEHYLSRGGRARFHTPNGLDSAEINGDIASLMQRANFTTLRLSLETAAEEQLEHIHRRSDSVEQLAAAIDSLRSAGYTPPEIGVYLLVGLPGQTLREVHDSIETVLELGGKPLLAEFSPIPGTELWDEAVDALKPLDIADEPLYHNNSVYYRLLPEFEDNTLPGLRHYINRRLTSFE